jgi:uncharacterized protein YdeI (YjbR/CyaY-like superfamily)
MEDLTETFFAPDRVAWRAWLEANHADKREIWLILLKARVKEPHLTLSEAVEEALCFGWIDGKLRSLGDREHALRFSPRKPGGTWAPSNKARVERLVREGRMTPAGLAAVEAAKRAGAWDSLERLEQFDEPPEDLRAALERHPGAVARFAAFTLAQRRDYIRWVATAVRPETRARRIAIVADRAARGVKPGQPDPPADGIPGRGA